VEFAATDTNALQAASHAARINRCHICVIPRTLTRIGNRQVADTTAFVHGDHFLCRYQRAIGDGSGLIARPLARGSKDRGRARRSNRFASRNVRHVSGDINECGGEQWKLLVVENANPAAGSQQGSARSIAEINASATYGVSKSYRKAPPRSSRFRNRSRIGNGTRVSLPPRIIRRF